jgi:putative phosphoesterase
MTIIGVLSDTHISPFGRRRLPPIVFERFEKVAFILHAGDLNTPQVLGELESIAPVYAVRGNNEDAEAFAQLPVARRIPVGECVIGLAHGDVPYSAENKPHMLMNAPGNRRTAANALSHFERDEAVNCVVFGHSHLPLEMTLQVAGREVLLFNPGSPTDRRYAPDFSCGLLRVDGRSIEAELIRW